MMEDGGWRMEDGGRRMEDGGYLRIKTWPGGVLCSSTDCRLSGGKYNQPTIGARDQSYF